MLSKLADGENLIWTRVLAGDPHCWYCWGHAGRSTADKMRVLPAMYQRIREDRIGSVRVVRAGAKRSKPLKPTAFEAIPILPVRAGSGTADREKVDDLDQLDSQGCGQPRREAP
jgi:hypothetical protein